jgi:hypothetical protein
VLAHTKIPTKETNMNAMDLLNEAADLNLYIRVKSDGIIDYSGQNASAAYDAIEAVEEADVVFYEVNAEGNGMTRVGWAMILIDLDEDEQIADCSGWVDVVTEVR